VFLSKLIDRQKQESNLLAVGERSKLVEKNALEIIYRVLFDGFNYLSASGRFIFATAVSQQ